jgi:hypothetical protein
MTVYEDSSKVPKQKADLAAVPLKKPAATGGVRHE